MYFCKKKIINKHLTRSVCVCLTEATLHLGRAQQPFEEEHRKMIVDTDFRQAFVNHVRPPQKGVRLIHSV